MGSAKAGIDWVYRRNNDAPVWHVGFFDKAGNWHSESAHTEPEAAHARCVYLNSSRHQRSKARTLLVDVAKAVCQHVEQWRATGKAPSYQSFLDLHAAAYQALLLDGNKLEKK